MRSLAQRVVAGAIGNGFGTQGQGTWRQDVGGAGGLPLPGEDVEDDVGTRDAGRERLPAGALDSLESVTEHRTQDRHDLPVAVVEAGELAMDAAQRARQGPSP